MQAGTGLDLDTLVLQSKYRLVEAKRFSKKICKFIMGIDLHARETGLEGVTCTKKVKCSVYSKAHEDNSWQPDSGLRKDLEPVCISPTKIESSEPAYRPQEEAAHTKTGLDATNASNLSHKEEFNLLSSDYAYKSLTKGPSLHGNLLAPFVRRNLNASAWPSTRSTHKDMQFSVVA